MTPKDTPPGAMEMSEARLADELERLLTWAGPQPWAVVEYGDEDSESLVIHSDDVNRVCFMATPGSNGDQAKIAATADLIVSLRNSLPTIIAALRECETLRAQVREGEKLLKTVPLPPNAITWEVGVELLNKLQTLAALAPQPAPTEGGKG